jgi:hypothetical protein
MINETISFLDVLYVYKEWGYHDVLTGEHCSKNRLIAD